MRTYAALACVVTAALVAGCATQAETPASTPSAPVATTANPSPAPASSPGARTVKSKDGSFEGEIIGTPTANSKFSKLQIGMTYREVNSLVGAPDDMLRHETGKRWIPFYFGADAQRMQVLYRGEGCLTYTGGNVFGGGANQLIRITVDSQGRCWKP